MMGIYVYNMRKKTKKIYVDGNPVDANFFSFAYKERWGCYDIDGSYRKMMEKAYRVGENAFESPRSGYVIVADAKDDLNGYAVYNNVRSGNWADYAEFPGVVVGFLHKEGRKYVVKSYSPWRTWNIYNAEKNCDESRNERSIVVDGKIVVEYEGV